MISKEELLKQKTKREMDMEYVEKRIDDKLKNIMPDTIENEKIIIKDIAIRHIVDEEAIDDVVKMYLTDGRYSKIEFEIKESKYSFDEYKYLDITLKL